MRRYITALLTAAVGLIPAHVEAGCNCNSGGGSAAVVGPVYGPVMDAPMMHSPMMMAPAMPMAQPAPARGLGIGMAPPPGTLGRTYTLKSRPVMIDDHPRISKIEITGASHLDLVIEGVEKYKGDRDDDGVWRFESDKPLVPGRPHIYKVHAVQRDAYNRKVPVDTRTVRMIPGRVLFINF